MSARSKVLLLLIIVIMLHVLTIALSADGEGAIQYYFFLGYLRDGVATGIGHIEVYVAFALLIILAVSLFRDETD